MLEFTDTELVISDLTVISAVDFVRLAVFYSHVVLTYVTLERHGLCDIQLSMGSKDSVGTCSLVIFISTKEKQHSIWSDLNH